MKERLSRGQLLFGALGAAGAAAVILAMLTVSGALFLRAYGLDPRAARPTTVPAYWRAYGKSAPPRLRAAMAFFLLLPWLASAGLVWLAVSERRRRPLHGDARFAGRAEIRRAGLLGSAADPRSILIGKWRGEFLAFAGSQFALLAAPTRSGKGVGVVIPNCLHYGESLVVLDIKEENFDLTSRYRRDVLGEEVYLFAPFDPEGRTHQWNPLSYVSKDPADRIGDLDSIAASLFSTSSEKERFWSENAKDLFRGLALFVLETPGIPHTMGEILRQASGCGRPLKDHVEEEAKRAAEAGRPYSRACLDSLNRVLQNGENTLTSILSTFNVPMLAFQNPRVDAATSSDTPGFDLREVRRRRMTVYLGISPDRLSQARVIVNLFFEQLLNLNTRRLPAQDPELRYQCLLILDEFTSIGRIPMIAQAVAYMAGYNMRLLTVIQNKSQLESVYGRAQAVTLMANHALQVIYAPSPVVMDDAREYSEMLGYSTVPARSRTRSLGSLKGSRSESVSEQRRALMLPQEMRELGTRREIVACENTRPVLAQKIRYYEEPLFKARLLGSIRSDIPRLAPRRDPPPAPKEPPPRPQESPGGKAAARTARAFCEGLRAKDKEMEQALSDTAFSYFEVLRGRTPADSGPRPAQSAGAAPENQTP